jgi:hypothetical protein
METTPANLSAVISPGSSLSRYAESSKRRERKDSASKFHSQTDHVTELGAH